MPVRIASAFAVHLGDWLRTEIVEPHGTSVTDAARHLGVTRQAMSNLLNAVPACRRTWRSTSKGRSA